MRHCILHHFPSSILPVIHTKDNLLSEFLYGTKLFATISQLSLCQNGSNVVKSKPYKIYVTAARFSDFY
jgi:hypothetical protein